MAVLWALGALLLVSLAVLWLPLRWRLRFRTRRAAHLVRIEVGLPGIVLRRWRLVPRRHSTSGHTTVRWHAVHPGARGGHAPHVAARPILRALRGHLGISRLWIRVRVGTGDPALTALVCGALWGLVGAAAGVALCWAGGGAPPQLEVEPDHRGARLEASGECIGQIRLGHVIVAAARALWVARCR